MHSRLVASSNFLLFLCRTIALAGILASCAKNGFDPSKITQRPRIFIEGAAPVPIIDEYDVTGVRLSSFSDIFNSDPNARIYGVWIGVDRRAAMTLQSETTKNIGRNLNLVVNGSVIGIHPIEKTVSSGFIPFIFTRKLSEEESVIFYQQLETSVLHLQLELLNQKN